MRRLDRSRPFGTFRGQPEIPEGCNRIAFYTQDDKLFDAHDWEIIRGVTLEQVPAQAKRTPRTGPLAPRTLAKTPEPAVAVERIEPEDYADY
jgi:hypothetical protein